MIGYFSVILSKGKTIAVFDTSVNLLEFHSDQQIVAKLINAINETNEFVKNVDFGDNYWGLMSELYLSNPAYIEVTDNLF